VPVKSRSTTVRLLLLALAAAAVAVGFAGCGGSSGKDAKALLNRAFSQPINSANVTIDLGATVDGVPSLTQPIRIKLGGPYKTNGSGKLPSLSWDVNVSGGGQNFSVGLITIPDNAYVTFQGTSYEAGRQAIARYNRSLATRNPNRASGLKQFGVDPLSWVKDPKEQGDATVAGVSTTHVSAGLDVGKFFGDVNKILSKARGGLAGGTSAQQLSKQQIDQVSKALKDPKFDVYVGKSDSKIRRVNVGFSIDVPKSAQTGSGGVKSANVTLSIEFAGVGEPQRIQAPKSARPLSELTKQLGGLGGLGSALGGAAGGAGAVGAAGGGGGSSPSQQQFKRYSQCLNKAKPSDVAAIQACASLLK
jgi:hypothetical protein